MLTSTNTRRGLHWPLNLALLMCLSPQWLIAQEVISAARYDRALAERLAGVAPLILNSRLTPHWRGGKRDRFSYRRELGEGASEFVEVDAASGEKRAPFDASTVAQGIGRILGKVVDPRRLPFVDYDEAADAIDFVDGDQNFHCSTVRAACSKSPKIPVGSTESLSPNGVWIAYLEGGNLWVRSTDGKRRFTLTSDAELRNGYALETESTIALEIFGPFKTPVGGGTSRVGPPVPPGFLSVKWSPDSSKLLTHRIDERNVRDISISQHSPTDGSTRPITWTWKSAAPNDVVVPMAELWVFDLRSRSGHKLAVDPIPVPYLSPLAAERLWWQPDSRHAALIRYSRYKKSVGISLIDTVANTVSTPIMETGETFVEVAADEERPMVRILSSGDIIWYSERSGYAHLYLYDGKAGRLKRQLTRGSIAVTDVLRVDEARGLVYVAMNSDSTDDDPYLRKVYSVRISDGKMTLLTPEAADHDVVVQTGGVFLMMRGVPESTAAATLGFSPSGEYFVDAYSRTGVPTRFVLRRADGALVSVIETSDVSRLQARGWVPPERFHALASDGKTQVWGTIWKPHDFDPTKSYAVLDSDYPGPQIYRAHPGFAASAMELFDSQAYAELGLVVVAIDGRGTPGRSKTFRNLSYGKLGDAGGLDDHISAIRELSRSRRWFNAERVGIVGSSGGGFAAVRAMFKYPDFYKVGVADAGNHDLRGYLASWAETYMGPDVGGSYLSAANAPLAAQLKGKLLLLHGDMDANVPPALTLQVADSLLRANKEFELLIVPNMGHTTLYSVGRPLQVAWDFLVKNLISATPPAGYIMAVPACDNACAMSH